MVLYPTGSVSCPTGGGAIACVFSISSSSCVDVLSRPSLSPSVESLPPFELVFKLLRRFAAGALLLLSARPIELVVVVPFSPDASFDDDCNGLVAEAFLAEVGRVEVRLRFEEIEPGEDISTPF